MKRRTVSEEDRMIFIDRYQNGEKISKIAKDLDYCYSTIHKNLKHKGIKIRGESHLSSKKYFFNINIFDIIDTEEKAYWLGFLYADGCNHEAGYSVILSLAKEDGEHVHSFARFIDTTNTPNEFVCKPKFICNKLKKSIIQNQISLRSHNKHFSRRLSELGMVNAKTLILTFPTNQQVPEDLIRHFIRGYFDGDGHFSHSLKKKFGTVEYVMGFTSTESFIKEIQKYVYKVTNRNGYISTRFPSANNSIRTLTLSGNISVQKFADWLYEGASISLPRKRAEYNCLRNLNDKNGICIIQYDKKQNIIQIYNSIRDIDPLFHSSKIKQCCTLNENYPNRIFTYKKYIWRYTK